MKELEFQAHVLRVARATGWRVFHVSDSRRTVTDQDGVSYLRGDELTKGWPDLVLVRGTEILIRELKSNKGRVRPEQQEWMEALELAGLDVGVWRPRDFTVIEKALGRRRRAA